MWKILGGVLVGVFLGALAVEVLKRTRPDLLSSVEDRAREAADALSFAFRERASRVREAVEDEP